MMGGRFGWLAGAVCGLMISTAHAGSAASSAFTYQGQLKVGGVPADGLFGFEFRLFDSAENGAQQGDVIVKNDVEVENGLFMVSLDFGASAFTGEARWLEVSLEGMALSPRQALASVPYALHALDAPAGGSNWIDNGANVFLIPGNAGIGTDAPTAMLHLQRPLADTGLRFQTVRFAEGPPATQHLSPASASAGGGGQAWSSPDSSRLSDDARATVSFSAAAGTPDNDTSQTLDMTNLGFTIPAQALVVGITVDVEGLGTCDCSDCDRCTINGTAELLGGSSSSAQSSLTFGDVDSVQTLGGTMAQWDVELTPADINSPTFGVRLSGSFSLLETFICIPGFGCSYTPCDCTGSGNAAIDAVSVTVSYYDISVTSTPVDWSLGIPQATSALHLSPTADLSDPAVYIDTGGHVGVNTTTPGIFHLAVVGFAAKSTGTSWSALSDARLKQNIEPINGALDRLLSLRGVTFEFTERGLASGMAVPGRQMGLIAQEVEPFFPEWVSESEDGTKFITESGTTALMVEALRELRAETDRNLTELWAGMDAQLAAKDVELAALKERLTRLEAALSQHFNNRQENK